MAPQPLHVRIAITDEGMNLVADSVGDIKSVDHIDTAAVIEQSARVCALVEPGFRRDNEFLTIIRDLSQCLIKPIASAIESCSEVIIKLPRSALGIPLDLLTYQHSPLCLKKPISYRIKETSKEPFLCQSSCSALILSDVTADPQGACLAVSRLLNKSTYRDARETTLDFLRGQTSKDVIVFSLHAEVDGQEPDHMRIRSDSVFPDDLNGLQPRLIYLDSCRLGISWPFLSEFLAMGTSYYIAPIISNEAGGSSGRTMITFFEHLLAGNTPEVALFLTKRELWHLYEKCDLRSRWWKVFAFRVYRLN